MPPQICLESAKTEIEKIMMNLPSDVSEIERRMYLAGYIDGIRAANGISAEDRDTLYMEYAF